MRKKKVSRSAGTLAQSTHSALVESAMQEQLQKAAENGDMLAQFNLAVMHMKGECGPVTKDTLQTVVYWFIQSARCGYPPAQHALGIIYSGANAEFQSLGGIPKDESKAFENFTLASKQDHVDAHYRLGILYKDSSELRDEEKAFQHFMLAAKENHPEAQYHLGLMCEGGHGMAEEALDWLKKAAAQGYSEALYDLGIRLEKDHRTEREALDYFKKAAEKGHKKAQYWLAVMYQEGRGTEINAATAMLWLKKAAAPTDSVPGYSDAQYRLAQMHMKGLNGVVANKLRGRELLGLAAAQGHADALYDLGVIYEAGSGVLKNSDKALKHLTQAADKGHKEAQFHLGVKYEEGQGVEKDELKALHYLTKAAEDGHKEALFRLGVKYQEGQGVEKDGLKALNYLTKATEENHPAAKLYLNSLLEKSTFSNNIYSGIKQLVVTTQNVLGDNYNVSKIFHTLLPKGIPELADEFFYYYTYAIYPSEKDIPAVKQPETVYLYIESNKLHYYGLNYGGTLDTPADFNLDRLKDVSFIDVPPTSGNIRQVYSASDESGCVYQVIDDKGHLKVGYIELSPGENEAFIKKKLLEALVLGRKGESFCLSKEETLNKFLKEELNAQLIQKGCFEPSYEYRPTMGKQYEEICTYENNFNTFLEKLIENLEHDEFNALIEGGEEFKTLKNDIISTANKLIANQQIICQNLRSNFQNSSQMIDTLKTAYQATINLVDFYSMACLMKELDAIFTNMPPNQKELITSFFYNHRGLLLNDCSSLINFPAMFSAQFLTRRNLLFQSLAKYFRKKHNKFQELETIFVMVERMAFTSNIAHGSTHPEAKLDLQTRLNQENNIFKTICFDLLKPIWYLLVMDTQQTEALVIYRSLLESQRPTILKVLGCLQEQLEKILQFAVKPILPVTAEEILPAADMEKFLVAIAEEVLDAESGETLQAKAQAILEAKAQEILPAQVREILGCMPEPILQAITDKILQAEVDRIIRFIQNIKDTCNLNDIIHYLVPTIQVIGSLLSLTGGGYQNSPKTSKSEDLSDQMQSLGTGQATADDISEPARSPRTECRLGNIPEPKPIKRSHRNSSIAAGFLSSIGSCKYDPEVLDQLSSRKEGERKFYHQEGRTADSKASGISPSTRKRKDKPSGLESSVKITDANDAKDEQQDLILSSKRKDESQRAKRRLRHISDQLGLTLGPKFSYNSQVLRKGGKAKPAKLKLPFFNNNDPNETSKDNGSTVFLALEK